MSSVIERLKELLSAATPGPWRHNSPYRVYAPPGSNPHASEEDKDDEVLLWEYKHCDHTNENDSELAVFFRNNGHKLIAAYEAEHKLRRHYEERPDEDDSESHSEWRRERNELEQSADRAVRELEGE